MHFNVFFVCILVHLVSVLPVMKAEPWEDLKPSATAAVQAEAVEKLLERLVGAQANHLFQVVVDESVAPGKNGDRVSLETLVNATDGSTFARVTANSGVAAALGVNHYLKYFCDSHVSWDTIRIALPNPLPSANFTLTSVDKFRYYANVCTFGYSFTFWDWPQWQKHIDWMALSGINMPLSSVGLEAIWNRVYLGLGLTQQDIDGHFTGPAFLPWHRMGNMNTYGGPLPTSWHAFTVDLQHKILDHMRSLGMLPVITGFAGHIPFALTQLYPNITYSTLYWNLGNYTYLMDFMDPMFVPIGTAFINEYRAEFGETDHVYNCDAFNEMDPSSNDTAYIARSGAAIYEGMSTADPNAVWMMQGWLFRYGTFWENPQVEALMTSVPRGAMIMLDLDSTDIEQYTRTEFYFGQPFVFNDLNNFGGQVGMFGRMGVINSRSFEARTSAQGRMIGTGLTLEGMSDAYITQEFMMEMSWRDGPVADMMEWAARYADRRYGKANPSAQEAWRLLARSAYNTNRSGTFSRTGLITDLPRFNRTKFVWYDEQDVVTAWDNFIVAAGELGAESGFRYDLIDVTRQALSDIVWHLYTDLQNAFQANDPDLFHSSGLVILDLLADLERVLATDVRFMLGPAWLEDAKRLAQTPDEEALYEFNARNQITLWGPKGEILDYAGKEWAGLVGQYYLPRWRMFLEMVEESLLGATSFNQSEFRERFMEEQGTPFTFDRSVFPSEPAEETLLVADQVYQKWRFRVREVKGEEGASYENEISADEVSSGETPSNDEFISNDIPDLPMDKDEDKVLVVVM